MVNDGCRIPDNVSPMNFYSFRVYFVSKPAYKETIYYRGLVSPINNLEISDSLPHLSSAWVISAGELVTPLRERNCTIATSPRSTALSDRANVHENTLTRIYGQAYSNPSMREYTVLARIVPTCTDMHAGQLHTHTHTHQSSKHTTQHDVQARDHSRADKVWYRVCIRDCRGSQLRQALQCVEQLACSHDTQHGGAIVCTQTNTV